MRTASLRYVTFSPMSNSSPQPSTTVTRPSGHELTCERPKAVLTAAQMSERESTVTSITGQTAVRSDTRALTCWGLASYWR
jgi:hypothetical protein